MIRALDVALDFPCRGAIGVQRCTDATQVTARSEPRCPDATLRALTTCTRSPGNHRVRVSYAIAIDATKVRVQHTPESWRCANSASAQMPGTTIHGSGHIAHFRDTSRPPTFSLLNNVPRCNPRYRAKWLWYQRTPVALVGVERLQFLQQLLVVISDDCCRLGRSLSDGRYLSDRTRQLISPVCDPSRAPGPAICRPNPAKEPPLIPAR